MWEYFLSRSSWYHTAHCSAWGQLQASPACFCDTKSITISTKHWCMILTGENRSTIQKARPSTAVSPTKLTGDQTRAFAVKDRRIIAQPWQIPLLLSKLNRHISDLQWNGIRLSVRLSACVSADPTGRFTLILKLLISMECDEKFQIWLKPGKNIERFTWRAK